MRKFEKYIFWSLSLLFIIFVELTAFFISLWRSLLSIHVAKRHLSSFTGEDREGIHIIILWILSFPLCQGWYQTGTKLVEDTIQDILKTQQTEHWFCKNQDITIHHTSPINPNINQQPLHSSPLITKILCFRCHSKNTNLAFRILPLDLDPYPACFLFSFNWCFFSFFYQSTYSIIVLWLLTGQIKLNC